MNSKESLLGYIYNSRKQRYFEVHVVNEQIFYVECEPQEVNEKKLFSEDTLRDDAVSMANLKRAKYKKLHS